MRADTPAEALRRYIGEQDSKATFQQDGSLIVGGNRYAHPLAYVEANYKINGEWQMHELPDWTWQDDIAEAFCGESGDGPRSLTGECYPLLSEEFPGVKAKSFVWYIGKGAIVTFYRGSRSRYSVLRRYLCDWDGKDLTVEKWEGDDEQVLEAVAGLQPPRLRR